MNPGITIARLTGEFGKRSQEAWRLHQWQLQRDLRERREQQDEIEADEAEFVDMALSIVSAEVIADFRVELDTYDEATTAALQDVVERLDIAQQRVDDILEQAHVLPDGRRVFKTKDGLRVFDEHGVELAPSEIDPDEIADHLTR